MRRYPTLYLPIQRGPIHGFYHFFVGYFIPLYWAMSKDRTKKYAVMDAHPLNPWFDLLPGGTPEIIDQAKTVKLAYLARRFGFARGYRVKAFFGWDKWQWFGKRNLGEIARIMRSDFDKLARTVTTSQPEVIILGRDHTPEHYAKNLPTRYGTAKRNIPNLREVADYLGRSFTVELVDGALLTPQEMVTKCLGAKVLIGQHGAALTNLFFMKPGSHVIEIGWPDLESDTALEMYRLMCEQLGHHWTRPILQTDRFAEIAPADVSALVRDALGE